MCFVTGGSADIGVLYASLISDTLPAGSLQVSGVISAWC